MKKKLSTLPFKGTPAQEEELRAYISENSDKQGALMSILQKAQDIYGYLPKEVQVLIAECTGIPIAEIYGVATFYSQFNLTPKGKYNISVCLGTACYVKGAQNLVDAISEKIGIKAEECTPDGKFSLEACRCIGACGLAPVLTVNDDVYGRLEEKDIDKIIEKYQALD